VLSVTLRQPLVPPGLLGRPVTARPMIMRWISEVPSKIVKLSGGLERSSARADDRALGPAGSR
jgi:hypothetical protein